MAGLVAGIFSALQFESSLTESLKPLADFRFYILRNAGVVEQRTFFIIKEIFRVLLVPAPYRSVARSYSFSVAMLVAPSTEPLSFAPASSFFGRAA